MSLLLIGSKFFFLLQAVLEAMILFMCFGVILLFFV